MTFYFDYFDVSRMCGFSESPMSALLGYQMSFMKWAVFSPCHLPLQVHRMLMLATSVLTCIAFVLPFVHRGGWSRVRMPSAAGFPINLFWCQGRLLLYSQRWIMRHFCVHAFFLFLSYLMTSPGWGLGQKGDREYRLLGTDVFLGCITSHAFL